MSFLQSIRNFWRRKPEEKKVQYADFYVKGGLMSDAFGALKKSYSVTPDKSSWSIGVGAEAEFYAASVNKDAFYSPLSVSALAGYDAFTGMMEMAGYLNFNFDVEAAKEEGIAVKSIGLGLTSHYFTEVVGKTGQKDLVAEFKAEANRMISNVTGGSFLVDMIYDEITSKNLDTVSKSLYTREANETNPDKVQLIEKDQLKRLLAWKIYSSDRSRFDDGLDANSTHDKLNQTMKEEKQDYKVDIKKADLSAVLKDTNLNVLSNDSALNLKKAQTDVCFGDFEDKAATGSSPATREFKVDTGRDDSIDVEISKSAINSIKSNVRTKIGNLLSAKDLSADLDKVTAKKDQIALSTVLAKYDNLLKDYLTTPEHVSSFNNGLTLDSWLYFGMSILSLRAQLAYSVSGHTFLVDVRNVGASGVLSVGYNAYSLQQN